MVQPQFEVVLTDFLAFHIPCRPKYDSCVFGFSTRRPASLRSTISSRMKFYLFFAFLNILQNASYLCSKKSMKKHVGTYIRKFCASKQTLRQCLLKILKIFQFFVVNTDEMYSVFLYKNEAFCTPKIGLFSVVLRYILAPDYYNNALIITHYIFIRQPNYGVHLHRVT